MEVGERRKLWLAVIFITPLLFVLPRYAAALNANLLGENEAAHLGLDMEKIKIRLIILVALVVGIAVSLSGVIGFVGLVVPHLIRLACGPDHRLLLPASALFGATLLTAADLIARTAAAPAEIPIGIITALLGGPFFSVAITEVPAGEDRAMKLPYQPTAVAAAVAPASSVPKSQSASSPHYSADRFSCGYY